MNGTSDYDMSLLGAAVRERRQATRRTQDQLAEAASVSSSFVSLIWPDFSSDLVVRYLLSAGIGSVSA